MVFWRPLGVLLLGLLVPCLPAWETFGTPQGLPSPVVSAVAQDDEGFLWLATGNGLARWDGYKTKVWQKDPFSANSLSSNSIRSLTVDGGLLWLGTNAGLDKFDTATGEFQHFPCDAVTSVLRDSHQHLWVATLGGLNLLEEASSTLRRLGNDSRVFSMAEDRRGHLWLGTALGLERLSDDQTSVLTFDLLFPGKPLPQGELRSVLVDNEGEVLWLGIWGQGLTRFDLQTGTAQLTKLPDNQITHLDAGAKRVLFVATDGSGLVIFDRVTGTFREEKHDKARHDSLAHDRVNGVMTDRTGILWVPTAKGVSFLSPSRVVLPATEVRGKVTAMYRDSRSRLWVGLAGRGASLFHEQVGVEPSLSNDTVHALAEDAQGSLWWATDNGLVRVDTAKGTVQRWGVAEGLPSNSLTSLLIDADGSFWIGTTQQGLLHRSPPGTSGPQTTYLPRTPINFSFSDRRGRLWVGTETGLARVQASGDPLIWRHNLADRRSLGGDSVLSMLEDSQGQLWFATDGGLSRYDETTSTFTTLGRAEGLDNLCVLGLQEDLSGNLWVATSDGLFRLLPSSTFVRFDTTEGLPSAEFVAGALRLEGRLAFGGANFVTVFDPESLKKSLPPSQLAFTSLTVVNQDRPLKNPLELAWNENSVTLGFALLEFARPEHHLFRYQLEGFDKDWVDAGTSHEVRYTGLDPGSYQFRLQGSPGNGEWISGWGNLSIKVEAAPWQQWYAWMLYVVAAIVMILFAGRMLYDRRWKQKVLELENVRSLLLEANQQLDQLSRLDSLTSIPNRRALDAWLSNEWAIAQRQKHKVALIMLDIDYFKRYNDNYGHLMGDACLRRVAKVLSDSLHRTTDFCARYGGEEFVVMLHDTELDGAEVVAQRLLEAIDVLRIPHEKSSVAPYITISLGVASLQPHPDSLPQALVQLADQALYQAKAGGRHRVALAVSS